MAKYSSQVIGGATPWVTLNNGVKMPLLGLGLHGLQDEDLKTAFPAALKAGYRLFDGAANYRNESEVGEAIKNSGIAREEIFITSKVRNSMHAYDDTLREFESIISALRVDYLDLFLIHFPCPKDGKYLECWRAMERLYDEKVIRAIGVSNFTPKHIENILANCHVVPAVNQFECNPYLTEETLRAYCASKGIVSQAYFPLGGPKAPDGLPAPVKVLLEDELIAELAKKYARSPAQILLRWETQAGMSVVPKSKNPVRLIENISIFDFELTSEDFERVRALNHNRRIGIDPELVEPFKVAHIE